MPPTVSLDGRAIDNYIRLASLSQKERGDAFNSQSDEQKAKFVRIHYALQFVKQSNLTAAQQGFLLDAISVTSPEIYAKTNIENIRLYEKIGQELETKAMSVFEPNRAAAILSPLFSKKDEDVSLLQNYQDVLTIETASRRKHTRTLPLADRANIWKVQMAYHLAMSSLKDQQRGFIAELIPKILPLLESTSVMSREEHAKNGEVLEESMFRLFTKPEAFAIFMEIGVQKHVKRNMNSVAFQKISATRSNCDCRWYCGIGDGYSCKGTNCEQVLNCGPFGDWTCLNYCQIDLPEGDPEH